MVIDKIRKMSIKGVKLKSESYFSISPGVLELWRKNLGGGAESAPPVQIGLMALTGLTLDSNCITMLATILAQH